MALAEDIQKEVSEGRKAWTLDICPRLMDIYGTTYHACHTRPYDAQSRQLILLYNRDQIYHLSMRRLFCGEVADE
tara:strand:- start:399 stop:623 length:225 start_codon:yes stop_codon:yes gene_type:complete